MRRVRNILIVPLIPLAILAGLAVRLSACDVPVYRYALERWEPDVYHLVVFDRGPLDEARARALDALRKASSEGGGHANLRVHVVNPDGDMPETLRTLWADQQAAETPWMVLLYPQSKVGNRVAWSAGLSPDSAEALLAGPTRREIARRITDGQTAVWVLVESGDRRRDDAAADLIARELARMPRLLTLPREIADHAPHLAAHLRIEFTLLRISRTDPAERVLAALLLGSEADLLTAYADQPVAFPVFGRGRTLFAVVGDGISPANVLMACRFLVGRCSCEIKDDNPGIDLLIDHPWQRSITVSLVDMVDLPLPIEQEEPAAVAAPDPASNAGQSAAGSRPALLRNTLGALVLISLAAALLALRAIKRTRRNS